MSFFLFPKRKGTAGVALVLTAAALAVLPLALRGPSCGHDFDFHLLCWIDALTALRHGQLPHWAPSAAFAAGEPRFVFYPPLSWALGAALGALLPWRLVPLALTFLLLAATGLATRALARRLLGETEATLAGVLALGSGYALFTAFERTAFAELTAGFWLPLLVLTALDGFFSLAAPSEGTVACPATFPHRASLGRFTGRENEPSCRTRLARVVPLAVVVAGCWLSNIPLGVMAAYLLAALALAASALRLFADWRELRAPEPAAEPKSPSPLHCACRVAFAPLLRAALGFALGTALVAFYLLPAMASQSAVDLSQATDDPGLRVENSWLFAHHADPLLAGHDFELAKVSRIGTAMIALALAAFLLAWARRRLPSAAWATILVLIPAVVLLLQLPLSAPLWQLAPKLRMLQFPWRWLAAVEAPMAILVAAALWPTARRRAVRLGAALLATLLLSAVILWSGRSYFQPCFPEDSIESTLAAVGSGTGLTGYDEYTPPGADNATLAANLPDTCLSADLLTPLGRKPSAEATDSPPSDAAAEPADSGDDDAPLRWSPAEDSCLATYALRRPAPERFALSASLPRSGFLILKLRRFPSWHLRLNGRPVESLPGRTDGLMVVPVAAGALALAIDWQPLPWQGVARAISLLALALLIGLAIVGRRHPTAGPRAE